MRECEDLLYTDPSTLLLADRGLLDVVFDNLGSGPAIDQRSEIQAALADAHPDDTLDGSSIFNSTGGPY